MSNPPGPDHPKESDPAEHLAAASDPAEAADAATDSEESVGDAAETSQTEAIAEAPAHHEPATEIIKTPPAEEPATEVFSLAKAPQAGPEPEPEPERRFTAPGFDAGKTQIIAPTAEPATEVFATAAPPAPPVTPVKTAAPQAIPPRGDAPRPPRKQRSWGWVIALLLVIAALVAVAILGTVLLTRHKEPAVSQEDLVRTTITDFDSAIKKGDLATLRSITCGATRQIYVEFDERAWAEVHERVAAAEEYPVVASIDQVVVNGDRAEANVTTFIAKSSSVRSTRSFDLQWADEQWKICQGP